MSEHRIRITLDEMLERRGMTLTELSVAVDISLVNLSILKTGKAKAIRFSTLDALCRICTGFPILPVRGTSRL